MESGSKNIIFIPSLTKKNRRSILELYFTVKLRVDSKVNIRVHDLWSRINIFCAPIKLKFTKGQITEFLEEKNILVENIGNTAFFIGIDFTDHDDITKYMDMNTDVLKFRDRE